MEKKYRILLIGCGGSAGINYARALQLSKLNYYIVGADINKYYLEASTVDKRYHLPHTREHEEKYIRDLNTLIKKERIDFVHAQPDPEVAILSKYRNRIKTATLLPSPKAITIFHDKWRSYEALQKKKVPVPATWRIEKKEDIRAVFKKNKGETLWLRAIHGAGGKASLPVESVEQAVMWIEYWIPKGLHWHDFTLSEILPGREVSWLSIWHDGKLICSQQKERFEWVQGSISPSGIGGTTAIQKTVGYDNVNDIGTQTVLAVEKKPQGIYVVDTKLNKKGVPCVTEVNPGRFFTTSLFFATAGVNMPDIYTRLGLGERIPAVKQYNAVKNDIFWIRIIDGETAMISKNNWTSNIL